MATLKTIATSLGIDTSTVSYALNGKGKQMGISAERVEQIHKVAREMNYRPNTSARNIRKGRFDNVALLLGHQWYVSNVPGSLLDGVEETLESNNLRMSIARLPASHQLDAQKVPYILREMATDGLLVDYGDRIPDHVRQIVSASDLPLVWINSDFEQDCIGPDEHRGGRAAAEYLLRLGHRRIGYSYFNWSHADLKVAHYSAQQRYAACLEVLREAGLPLLLGAISSSEREPGEDVEGGIAAAVKCLRDPARPTAIITYSAWDAMIFAAAAYRLGMRMPEELSLIAFQDRIERVLDKALTTMFIPQRRIGQQAVSMLLSKIAAPRVPLPAEMVELTLTEGGTCAPPMG